MNFSQINLDLQSTMKRIYASLLYRSSSMNLANRRYMEAARTETAVIEVIKALQTPVNTRATVELANSSNIATPLTPQLMTYDSVKVDLTELRMDYSFMVSPVAMGSGLIGAIDDQLALKDAAKKYPEWYQNRIIDKKPRGTWTCKPDLYQKEFPLCRLGYRYEEDTAAFA